ncbi:hypothetical protein HC928_10305 [bacterium]|nr:hypothetical protein [bacterium]
MEKYPEIAFKNRQFVSVDGINDERANRLNDARDVLSEQMWNAVGIQINERKEAKRKLRMSTTSKKPVSFADIRNVFETGFQVFRTENKKKNWRHVAFFIMLATGRRMNEVLSSYTSYEKVGEYQIKSVGLSKSKRQRDYDYQEQGLVYPTLVPADLVLEARQWLADRNKLVAPADDTPSEILKHRERINKANSVLTNDVKHIGLGDISCHDLRKFMQLLALSCIRIQRKTTSISTSLRF